MTDSETEIETAAEPSDQDEPVLRYGAPVSDSRGQLVLHPTRDHWIETAEAARDDGFDQLIDVTAVDYLTYAGSRRLPGGLLPERFEVVANLLSHDRCDRIRLRTQVPADDPTVPSLFDLWPGAEAMEREVFDMYGIAFVDHPDPTRILMPEDWVGHPLRKDYATGSIPVQFKAASNIR